MNPVRAITGTMVPLDRADVDTDQIIPQQFLKRIERDGYGDFLFYNWAHTDDGTPSSDFIINSPDRRGAKVLVAGPNFGCGSSREHAPWAIQQWGFDAVITPSAADIFRNNSSFTGLLIVVAVERLSRPEVLGMNGAAAPRSGLDRALHVVRAAEQLRRTLDVPLQQVIEPFHQLDDHDFLNPGHALEKTRSSS